MYTKTFDLGTQSVKIETGLIAKQANASATVDIDGNGLITGISGLVPGSGYTTDPIITVNSGTVNELRAADQKEILISNLIQSSRDRLS